jgi:hypothetical protein
MTIQFFTPRRFSKSITFGLAAFSLFNSLSNFGPVGIAIDLHQPAFTMKVGDLDPKNPAGAAEPGSPADATGAFKVG